MSLKYEVIEAKVLRNKETGRQVSPYGAHPEPWNVEAWELVTKGWTVYNQRTGQIGIGRTPWATKAEAEAFAATHTPSSIGYGD